MLIPSPETILQCAALLGDESITCAEVEEKVAALAQDGMLARRLIDWIPEAFGLILIGHLAKIVLPKTFSARAADGSWVQLDMNVEPIFASALRLGVEMIHAEPRDQFARIASRSSLVNVVTKALNEGQSLDGATLSGPAFIGIPAEFYGYEVRPARPRFRGSSYRN